MKIYKLGYLQYFFIAVCFFAIIPKKNFANVTQYEGSFLASVDKNTIDKDDYLKLTLTWVGNKKAPGTPQLEQSGLYQFFQKTSNGYGETTTIINGVSTIQSEWQLQLVPKKTGKLIIPPILLGQFESQPITINVSDSPQTPHYQQTSKPVFMKIISDHSQVFVQQQILITVKVFSKGTLYNDSVLTPLVIDNAIVKQVGETQQYEDVLQGIRHIIFELKFAIFPQKTGQLTIPTLIFTSTMATRNNNQFGIFSSTGTPVKASSNPVFIDVIPSPESWDQNLPWVPAKSLVLSEKWNKENDTLYVGDAITRTITLEAEGLTSAQLPTITTADISTAKNYPDTTKTEDTPVYSGILGKQISAIAFVPTQAGTMHIPPIEINWYDTQINAIKKAIIPEKTFTVLPSITTDQSSATKNTQTETEEKPTETSENIVSNQTQERSIWKIITIILSCLWALTIFLFLFSKRRRKKTKTINIPHQKPIVASNTAITMPKDEPSAFHEFTKACRAKSPVPQTITLSFKQWCRFFFKQTELQSLEQCYRAVKSEEISIFCEQINASRYGKNHSKIPAKKLLTACNQLRKNNLKNSQNDQLTRLYPD